MEHISEAVLWFFWMAMGLALLIPLLRTGLPKTSLWQPPPATMSHLKFSLPLFLLLSLLALPFGLDAGRGILPFLGALLGFWLLSCLNITPAMRGILLLAGGLLWFPVTGEPLAGGGLPAYLLGLTVGRLLERDQQSGDLSDFLIPAVGLTGHYWIGVSSPTSVLPIHQSLLLVFLGVALLVRTLGDLPFLEKQNALVRAAFLVAVAGMGGWLAVQAMLVQPQLLSWAGLFAGGALLGVLLSAGNPEEETRPLSAKLIALILIGLAALVASRLFGTLGWLVLAAGLLVVPQTRSAVLVATLYFVARTLLQGYIYQFNPNVTGINITHPYAGAALYVGFVALLLVPGLLNSRWLATENGSPVQHILPWALLLAGVILAGGLSNYFLHAEATASLLVAATVAGLSVSLLSPLRGMQTSQPLLLTLLLIQSALLLSELIAAGNEADRTQRMMVLAAALVIFGVLSALLQKFASGGKAVEVR